MKIKIEIDIPDQLLAEIQKVTSELEISLDDYFEMVLRERLQNHKSKKSEV